MYTYVANDIAHSRIAELHREAAARRRAAEVRRPLTERVSTWAAPLTAARRAVAQLLAGRAVRVRRTPAVACCAG